MTQAAPAIAVPESDTARGVAVGEYLLLNLGVIACSTSVLFLKACHSSPIIVAGMRLLIAGVLLIPMMMRDLRRQCVAGVFSIGQLKRSIPGAILLAVHFILWAFAARLTPAANATLIVNLSAIALPFVMWFVNGERINRGEVIGTAIAMAGVLTLMGQGYTIAGTGFRGDVTSFLAMIVFCCYIAVGRRAGQGRSIWLYVVPMYLLAGVLCLATAVIVRVPWPVLSVPEISRWAALGIFPTIVGHTIFNHSIKRLRGQTVSTFNLTQFIYAGILAYLLFGEAPPARMYMLAVIIAVGVVIVIRSSPATPRVAKQDVELAADNV